jgi:hypothetical protein
VGPLRVAGLCLLWICGLVGVASASELKQTTIAAFDHYVALSEGRIARELHDPDAFLWVDQQPAPRRQALLAQLHKGQVITQILETRENGQAILVPDGLVHHWLATVFVPGVKLAQTLAQQRNYDRSAEVYGPDIQRCKLLHADGNDLRVYYRLHRKVIVTATYNVDFDIRFVPVDGRREYSWARSTRIAEVVDADEPNESERPVGKDEGYLWRLNTYTRYEERDGGVYIQIEFLALSRSVPSIFAWLVNPYVKSVPQEYLVHVLQATRTDLMTTGEARSGAFASSAHGAAPTPQPPNVRTATESPLLPRMALHERDEGLSHTNQ